MEISNESSSTVPLSWLNKTLKISSLSFILIFFFFSRFSGILVEGSLATVVNPSEINSLSNDKNSYLATQNFLIAINPINAPTIIKKVVVTGYSSTPDQTDDTPFITASNKLVRDGIVACNFLDFGTKIRLPELFGDKIFVVEDRMHEKYSTNHIDIWFPDRETAQNFGIKETILEILE